MHLKFLLPIFLLAISCTPLPITHSPTEFPPPSNIPLVYSHSPTTYWICGVDDANQSLVWVSCTFRNTSPINDRTCVSVSFKSSCLSIFSDRDISTGWMSPSQSFDGYAAFTALRRSELNYVCGEKLDGCKLSVEGTTCPQ